MSGLSCLWGRGGCASGLQGEDPVGNLGLETEDFGLLTRAVLDVADTYAGGRIISVLEGGYHPERMADCMEMHLAEMIHHSG